MIIEYSSKYENSLKELIYELQDYIMSIDKEKYNFISPQYKGEYFNKVMKEIKEYQGKILLYKDNNKIVGAVVGCINNEEINNYDFKAPKRGRITELIISKEARKNGYGEILLKEMEQYLYNNGCKAILIGVFAYNESAINFYKKQDYHTRMIEIIKTNK